MNQIKLLVMDVDGTLTDGQIFMSPSGELCKAFDVKDGYAIKHFLPEAQIMPAIITGRNSLIVANRANELGITILQQGIDDKVSALTDIALELGLTMEQVAYIGDDLNDLPAMRLTGISACPCDAVAQVKAECDYICQSAGGRGAVREFVEWLIARNNAV